MLPTPQLQFLQQLSSLPHGSQSRMYQNVPVQRRQPSTASVPSLSADRQVQGLLGAPELKHKRDNQRTTILWQKGQASEQASVSFFFFNG